MATKGASGFAMDLFDQKSLFAEYIDPAYLHLQPSPLQGAEQSKCGASQIRTDEDEGYFDPVQHYLEHTSADHHFESFNWALNEGLRSPAPGHKKGFPAVNFVEPHKRTDDVLKMELDAPKTLDFTTVHAENLHLDSVADGSRPSAPGGPPQPNVWLGCSMPAPACQPIQEFIDQLLNMNMSQLSSGLSSLGRTATAMQLRELFKHEADIWYERACNKCGDQIGSAVHTNPEDIGPTSHYRSGARRMRDPGTSGSITTSTDSNSPLSIAAQIRYICTCCGRESGDAYQWKRHEAQHYLPMTCMPFGTPTSPNGICVICGEPDPNSDHKALHKNIKRCLRSNPTKRSRRDADKMLLHLDTHLENGRTLSEEGRLQRREQVQHWEVCLAFQEKALWCGFCRSSCSTWKERLEHVVDHLRSRCTMDEWVAFTH